MFLNPDKSLTLFSSKGKLDQCDNALTAALNGALAIGVAAQDGVVLLSFKNVSRLVDRSRYHKVFLACPTILITYAGLQPDFRVNLAVSQQICQEYFDIYEVWPPLDVFISEYSLSLQEHTQQAGMRPLGAFLLVAGAVRGGSAYARDASTPGVAVPALYQVDPSGSYRAVPVVAAGRGYEEAAAFLTRRREGLDDNLVNALLALRQFTGKDVAPEDVSIGVFRNGKASVYDYEAIKEVFDSLGNN